MPIKMKFDLDNINIGQLIRFKDELLKSNKINMSDFEIITDYLARFIGEEE